MEGSQFLARFVSGKLTKSLLSWESLHKHTWFLHNKFPIQYVLYICISL